MFLEEEGNYSRAVNETSLQAGQLSQFISSHSIKTDINMIHLKEPDQMSRLLENQSAHAAVHRPPQDEAVYFHAN